MSPAITTTPAQTAFRIDKSALAYGVFETEAASLTIDVSSTVPGQFEDFSDISVEDASGLTTYKVQFGKSTIMHSLPAGKTRVMVTAGLQTKFRNKIVGVFIDKITFDGPAIEVRPEGKRMLIYGDSLAVGGNVKHVSAEAWPLLLRKQFSIIVEAYGYRTLGEDAATAEARAEFASRVSSRRPDLIWLAIGANDVEFQLWSAAEFGEAYAATLDAIHSLSPQVTVFAQSPIRRSHEAANSFGDDLERYRQQIASACQTRTTWCVFVDGTAPAFPQPDELDPDGIHLTAESSAKYAEAVLEIVGKYRKGTGCTLITHNPYRMSKNISSVTRKCSRCC